MPNLLEILPYELIKIICDIIDPKTLVDICIRNGERGEPKKISNLYHLNYDRITTYWWLETTIDLIKNNDFYGVRYHMTLELDLTVNDNWYLKLACQLGSMVMIKYLSKNIDITTNDNIAVIIASENGHLPIIKYLVNHGANVKAQDNEAIVRACSEGHLDVVEYLTLSGADITVGDNLPMRVAQTFGHTHVVNYLASKGTPQSNDPFNGFRW
jgi:ankyrin repeat protein